jgi:fucose permease
MLLFILYVGAESSLGTWTFTLLTESRGVDVKLAGFLAGSYWLTFTIGRIAAGTFAMRIGVDRLVVGGLIGALIGAGLLIWNPSQMANLAAVAVIGVSIAPIFPAMTSGTSVRVGDHHAANTIGIQMAATGFGTATIPSLMGVLARRLSLEIIPVCLLVTFTVLFGTYFLDLKTRDTDPRRVEEPVDDFRPVP